MKMKALTIALLCSVLAVTACGRPSKSTTNVSTATTGQELDDLKAAFDNGALSEDEYEKKRKEILKKKG